MLRRMDFNRLLSKSTIHVMYIVIAKTKFAKAVKEVPAVFAQAFLPVAVAA